MTIRLLKTSMVFAVGLWALLIAADNILDYDSNWHFVQHVLSMDTVFPGNALKYRAITDPKIQALGYWMIIATEWVMSALCLTGAWGLFRARRNRLDFIAAKPLAACGLVLVFLMYFVGFVVVGGEWFCMWQSEMERAGQGRHVPDLRGAGADRAAAAGRGSEAMSAARPPEGARTAARSSPPAACLLASRSHAERLRRSSVDTALPRVSRSKGLANTSCGPMRRSTAFMSA